MVSHSSVQKQWNLLPQPEPKPEVIETAGGNLLVARLLAQRGLDSVQSARAFLDPAAYTPAPPSALTGVEAGAKVLLSAIKAGDRILVWGDFDVDGQTSTSLLVAALRKLCAADRVTYHVPNRFRESHGIQPDLLAAKLSDPKTRPDLLLTCDTGIDEGPAIGLAKDHGLKVVVTDHHDLPPEFAGLKAGRDPLWGMDAAVAGQKGVRRADAVINPKFLSAAHPLSALPGVGVAYKLVQQLYALCGCAGDEIELLDLVALGIVSDVAAQVDDTRYLLQRGLEQLRNTRRFGLLALMEVSRLTPASVDAEAIGFQIGPRMNALGRLDDATVAVELLTTTDPLRAQELAARMNRLNQDRRTLTTQTAAAAMEMIERTPRLLDFNGLVLAHPAWHAGIVGIVASRLAETYNRPTVLLLTPPGGPARGSARSVAGVDIGASIAACSHLLLTHGGHPGAAGLSLLPENIDRFRRELGRQIELHRDDTAPPGLTIDAELDPNLVDMDLAANLQILAPFGQGNPKPKFVSRHVEIISNRRIGRERAHRRMTIRSAADKAENSENHGDLAVIWFNGGDTELPDQPLDLVFTLEINDHRGERTVQLHYVDSRVAQQETTAPTSFPSSQLQIRDLRAEMDLPEQVHNPANVACYAEGLLPERADSISYAPRTKIARRGRAETLVIWTAPPSSEILQWLIDTVSPRELHLYAHQHADDSLAAVLRQVAGMCKFSLGHDRLLHLDRMAARLGTTEAVVRQSLLWLESRGQIVIEEWDPADQPDDTLRIGVGTGVEDRENGVILRAALEDELAEVRAFRRFYRRAKLHDLGLTPAA